MLNIHLELYITVFFVKFLFTYDLAWLIYILLKTQNQKTQAHSLTFVYLNNSPFIYLETTKLGGMFRVNCLCYGARSYSMFKIGTLNTHSLFLFSFSVSTTAAFQCLCCHMWQDKCPSNIYVIPPSLRPQSIIKIGKFKRCPASGVGLIMS